MAKTIRNQFDKYLTYEKLMEAHNLCRKGKNNRPETIRFNLKQEEYIRYLYDELKNGTYTHGGYRTFYATRPKLREIKASCYMDRIVHRWVVDNFLDKYFIKTFIPTSYACIKEKGIHNAALDIQKALRHCKNTWNEYYIFKMDVAKYFKNIDKNILLEILQRRIKDEKLMNLIKQILYSTEGDKGIPIGNYTSQTFANIYLNELDQYVKHDLKIKYYFRYMDDAIAIVKTKQEAKELFKNIEQFLDEKLQLKLNSKTMILKGKQGVNFCGYKINEYRIKIRDRGKKSLKAKIKKLKQQIQDGEMSSAEAYKYLSGHLGYIKIADTKNLETKLFYTLGKSSLQTIDLT